MLRSRIANPIVLIVIPLVLWSLMPGSALAQDNSKDVKAACDIVAKEYKNKKDRDYDNIQAVYVELETLYKDAKAADQKKIVKAIRKGFDLRTPDDLNYLKAAAGCLSAMGKAGCDALISAIDSKALEPKDKSDREQIRTCNEIRGFVIEAVGQTKETKAIKTLCKLLWKDDAILIKSTAISLGSYSDLEQKDRKPIVEELVKVYAYLEAQSAANPKKPHFRERLIAVEVSFNESLKMLTLQSFESAPDWQNWYNNNKNKKKW